MRVVAESAAAARRVDDAAVPRALGDDRLRIVGRANQHEHAVVVRASIVDVAQVGDQARVVARVGLRLAGVARADHAGRTAKRRHADTRVVGERRQLRVRARVTRLGQRVLDERRMRLVDFGDAEIGLRDQLDAERLEQAAELAELAGVVRGEDELSEHACVDRRAC